MALKKQADEKKQKLAKAHPMHMIKSLFSYILTSWHLTGCGDADLHGSFHTFFCNEPGHCQNIKKYQVTMLQQDILHMKIYNICKFKRISN